MIRISRLSDYAIVIMCELALNKGKVISSKFVSERTKISETTVIKILKALTKDNLIISCRGTKGGYSLSKEPFTITLLEIINAIDGPVSLTLCSKSGYLECEFEAECMAKTRWRKINDALHETLRRFTLTDFITI